MSEQNNSLLNMQRDEVMSSANPEHAVDDKERRRMQKAAFIKMAAMGIFVLVVFIFSSIAWFTMNKEVEGTGAQMTASNENFQITSSSGDGLSAGLWYDPYHKKIMGVSTENDADVPSGVWLMSDESNFGNYSYENVEERIGGIKPGSYGKVTFNVTPLIDTLDLQFTFDVIGYHSSDSMFNESSNSDNQPLTLTPLSEMGSNKADIAGYLDGHILLFEDRDPVYETTTITDPETGEESVVNTNRILRYTYSGLIATNEDMQRVLKNTEKTHFTGKDTTTPVVIYWVWPNTLSTLVDVGTKDDVEPFCTGDDLTAVTTYVLEHPTYFLKGYVADTSDEETPEENNAEEGGGEESTSSNALTLSDIVNDYVSYSDMYDMADNDIGMNVSYILLKLTATENTTVASAADPENPDPENQEP